MNIFVCALPISWKAQTREKKYLRLLVSYHRLIQFAAKNQFLINQLLENFTMKRDYSNNYIVSKSTIKYSRIKCR